MIEASTDTPRRTFSLMPRRATLTVVALLLALSAAAWWSTAVRAGDMGDMLMGLAHVGERTGHGMGAGLFVAMWVTMMVAMMFPTIAPIVLAHRMVIRRRNEGAMPTVAFVGGYLLIWSLIGLVPAAALLGFQEVTQRSAGARWVPTAAGIVLAMAGAYQFTRWKASCLRACRTPMSFLMTHDFKKGLRGALRAGMSHGAWCLGCCWALMAVLAVVGLMNLVWMAAIALVFLAEKNWRHGIGLTRIVGTGLVVLGLAIVVRPSILPAVAGGSGAPAMSDGQMSDGQMMDGQMMSDPMMGGS